MVAIANNYRGKTNSVGGLTFLQDKYGIVYQRAHHNLSKVSNTIRAKTLVETPAPSILEEVKVEVVLQVVDKKEREAIMVVAEADTARVIITIEIVIYVLKVLRTTINSPVKILFNNTMNHID